MRMAGLFYTQRAVLKDCSLLVGKAGFEPTTSCTPCKHATGLRYIPNWFAKIKTICKSTTGIAGKYAGCAFCTIVRLISTTALRSRRLRTSTLLHWVTQLRRIRVLALPEQLETRWL